MSASEMGHVLPDSSVHPSPLDTQLARLLHARGRLPLEALTQHLNAVRASRTDRPQASLAGSLVGASLLSEPEAAAYVQELNAWLEASATSAVAARPALPSQAGVEQTMAPAASAQDLSPGLLLSDELGWSGEGAGWRAGARIGPYLLGKKLGQGGMGVVFKAQHVETGEVHALKGLSSEADDVLLRRFAREIETQSKADRHPNVVRVHGSGESAGYRYLAMDLAAGGDLQERLRGQRYSQQEAARLVLDLARGLAHVHDCGILHRDLKPANVLFDAEGTPKLVDFGLAGLRSGTSALTKTGDILGTPSYMAPEQALGNFSRVDARADVYALGSILYECLTGDPPFIGSTVMEVLSLVITTPAPPLRDRDPSIDPALEEICLAALAKEPDQRTPSAAEFANALAGWLVSQEDQGATPQRSRALLWIGLTVVGLVVASVAAAVGLQQPTPTPTSSATQVVLPIPRRPAASPWAVKAGQKFEADFYLHSQSASSLRMSSGPILTGGNKGLQEMNVTATGEVQRVKAGVARIRFLVKAAKSRVRRISQPEDLEHNYLRDWPGKGFVIDFDAATGGPLEVHSNDLPRKPHDLSQRGTLFAELASDRSMLRFWDAAFNFFPRQAKDAGGHWVLSEEPFDALRQIVRVQIPRAAEHIGGPGFKVMFEGSDRQISLKESERTVHLDGQGRLRWGVPGDEPLPKPDPPGRDARGVATLAEGWIKESVVEEAFWLEYPEKPGGVPQIKVEMHVKRGVRLRLIKDEAPSGE
jgi:serine/threonine protein kinase